MCAFVHLRQRSNVSMSAFEACNCCVLRAAANPWTKQPLCVTVAASSSVASLLFIPFSSHSLSPSSVLLSWPPPPPPSSPPASPPSSSVPPLFSFLLLAANPTVESFSVSTHLCWISGRDLKLVSLQPCPRLLLLPLSASLFVLRGRRGMLINVKIVCTSSLRLSQRLNLAVSLGATFPVGTDQGGAIPLSAVPAQIPPPAFHSHATDVVNTSVDDKRMRSRLRVQLPGAFSP